MTDKKLKIDKKLLHFALSFFILIFTIYIFTGKLAEAAELSLTSQIEEIGVGQQFQIDVLLNTENEEINALEGLITFPQELLELKEIRDGNSFINFWIERPRIKTGGEIIFSGITPGGYKSDEVFIFSIIFRVKKAGSGIIGIKDVKTLLNDGKGTEAKIKVSNFSFVVIQDSIRNDSRIPVLPDNELPESFVPEIANSPSIFEGKWFLVFATQDKGTGIARYEVKETRQRIFGIFSKWFSVESPYVLSDQELRSYIFVKAVDKAGNERIVKVEPQNPLAWYENYENWIIIILAIIALFSIKFTLWKKLKI